jgi:outer membrane protein assembly factor BamB
MSRQRSSIFWLLATIVALCPLLVGLAMVLLFLVSGFSILSVFNMPTTGISYPPELLDGNEDRLANLAVIRLPLSPAWEYQAPGPIDRPPLYHTGHVVLTGDMSLWAVNASSGAEEWHYSSTHRIDASFSDDVHVLDNAVAFRMLPSPGPLHAIDLQTGHDRWQTPMAVRGFDSDLQSRLFVVSTNQDRVAKEYQALDAASGQVIWISNVHPEGRSGFVFYASYAHELYVGDETDALVVLDAETGSLLRRLNKELFGHSSPVLATDGILYALDFGPDRLFAVDSRENKLLWSKNYSLTSSIFKPIVHQDALYFGTSQETLLAIDRHTGNIRWQYPSSPDPSGSTRLLSNLVVLDGILYGIFSDARLRGFDPVTGQEIGHIQFVDVSDVSYDVTVPGLAASEDMLFVSLGKTKLYAFKTVP